MTVTLVPLPDGLIGEAEERLRYIIHAINGYAGQGIRFNLTEYDHAEKYALQVRNTNTPGGGLHFAVYLSSSTLASNPTPIFEVQDAAVFADIPVQFNSTFGVTGNVSMASHLTVAGNITAGGDVFVGDTLFVDEGVDIIGGGEISGTVVFHGQIQSTLTTGTAPFSVLSTTLVSNLNADLLDGHDASYFASQTDLDGAIGALDNIYVDQNGDTMTGDLEIQAQLQVVPGGLGNDEAIFFAHNSGRGQWRLGATDVTQTDAIFKDPTGTEVVRIGHSANPHSLEVFQGDAYFDVNIHVNDSAQIDNDLTVESTLTVNGSTNLGNATTDSTTIAGSISVGGSSSVFNGEVTFLDTIHLLAHTIDFDLGSTAGFSTSSWDGWITIRHDGVDKYVPYKSSPPS